MIREHSIPFDKLSVTRQELYKAIGYGASSPDEELRTMIEEVIGHVTSIGTARFLYRIVEGCPTGNTLLIADQTLHIGSIIANQLAGSERYALFVATTGHEFDEWLGNVKRSDDIVMQFIADSIGSCLAEKAADYMETCLEQDISPQALKRTNRFSPGYCGWHVAEQQKLFSLFPTPTPCGIQLIPSCLMIPIKSVSGIIGIGANVRKSDYSCGLCAYERCYKR